VNSARVCVSAALTSAALLLATPALADDDVLRCGGKLVSPGVTIDYVLAQCGEPQERIKETVPQMGRRANGTTFVTGEIEVEEWTYDRGSSRFPAVLRFEEGKLVRVEFLRE
jgi:hypothetical protein